jgi:prepilin-type N-terminal cleavage/methylation domain-containing protein
LNGYLRKHNAGFTLIELMITLLIVGILAAIAIPIFRGRLDSARWSEGKAIAGTLATAIRVYVSENGSNNIAETPTLAQLGFASDDLKGTYFTGGESGTGNFEWDITSGQPLAFTVTAKKGSGISSPQQYTLNQDGIWVEIP